MIIIGTHFFTWGAKGSSDPMHCQKCGAINPFIIKKGMRFITLFFLIPIFPISRVHEMIQCPNCKTKYQTQPQ